jgi:hypothetical protein
MIDKICWEFDALNVLKIQYSGVDKSLAQPGRKQAATDKIVMGRGMDWFGLDRDRWWAIVSAVINLQVP